MFDTSSQSSQVDSGYQLHLAKVTRIVVSGGAGTVYVTSPTLAPDYELGPCLSVVAYEDLDVGTLVVISTMNDGEQQAILGVVQPTG